LRCPKHEGDKPCEVEEIHYGTILYKVRKEDKELAERYGLNSMLTYRLLCGTHNTVFSSEEYDKDGWKSCRCEKCLRRDEEFQEKVAEQQLRGIPRWQPREVPQVQELELEEISDAVPF